MTESPLLQGKYIRRVVDDELDQLMPGLRAFLLEGLKGVGKTETARQRAQSEHRLDNDQHLALAAADPHAVLATSAPVLIDEWQRMPAIWDLVRRAVDDGVPPGPFLLTGSVAPVFLPLHSGAGRIVTVRMHPLSLAERGFEHPTVSLASLLSGEKADIEGATAVKLDRYVKEIVGSGLPDLQRLAARQQRAALGAWIDRLAERDFMEAGHRIRSPQLLRRWMRAYAAATSTCATLETIRDAATGGEGDKPSRSTTQPYREALERLFLVDPVPGWLPTRSRVARLATPPKHQLADPAFAAWLLGVDGDMLLSGRAPAQTMNADGVLLGALFESLVTLDIRVYSQLAEARVFHLRTKGGAKEIDLIVERADGKVVAIEVKLAATVHDNDVRHLLWLKRQIGGDLLDSLVISTGSDAYRRRDGVAVVPAALLGP